MSSKTGSELPSTEAINRGFSKQSAGYDAADKVNIILQDLRHQVYRHVQRYLKPASNILELNAGTGIDATFFASQGHRVHATDLSDGMVDQIRLKISGGNHPGISCQQLSFQELDKLSGKNYDYIFSNFGGLNCIQDLTTVTRHLRALLHPGGYVTWVIMPPVSLWEIIWIFKGEWSKAVRRLNRSGALANVEGESFRTYYHSLRSIRRALGPSFRLLESESLAALSPPPHHANFPIRHPQLYNIFKTLDGWVKNIFPFNRLGDHLIVTFQYLSEAD